MKKEIKKQVNDISEKVSFDEFNRDLPVRVSNCFRTEGIDCFEKLLSYSEEELLSKPNFGRKSFNHVRDKLYQFDCFFIKK
jgi:DNA-directed RNA polymerase alpha subunit